MVAAAAEEKRGCGLFCPSEVEESRPRPQWLELCCGAKVGVYGRGLNVEVVKGTKRLHAYIEPSDVHTLFRFMLDRLSEELLGGNGPTMTALYAVKALRDAAAEWLSAARAEARELEERLRDAEERARKHEALEKKLEKLRRQLEEIHRRLNEECGADRDCRERLWAELGGPKLYMEQNRIANEMTRLNICNEWECIEPPKAVKRLRRALMEARQRERRLAIAALALSHAWRALTHPSIEDLYGFTSEPSNGGLDAFLEPRKQAKESVGVAESG